MTVSISSACLTSSIRIQVESIRGVAGQAVVAVRTVTCQARRVASIVSHEAVRVAHADLASQVIRRTVRAAEHLARPDDSIS